MVIHIKKRKSLIKYMLIKRNIDMKALYKKQVHIQKKTLFENNCYQEKESSEEM